MARQFLKPREGLVVRNPFTKKPLPADGAEVKLTSYWRRRLKEGDVVKATPTATSTAATSSSSTTATADSGE